MKKYIIPGVAGAAIAIAVIFLFPINDSESLVISQQTQNMDSNGIMITNGIKHIVPLDKIRSGCPQKDGIQSLDDPKLATLTDSDFISSSYI